MKEPQEAPRPTEGKRFIYRLVMQNLLSFGKRTEVELLPLNVLIGPNSSGKSNLIGVIDLLACLPTDLHKPIREGGGVREWQWKGEGAAPLAQIQAVFDLARPSAGATLCYSLLLSAAGQQLMVSDETLAIQSILAPSGLLKVYWWDRNYAYARIPTKETHLVDDLNTRREVAFPHMDGSRSVLSQLRDPLNHPEITYLGDHLKLIRLYSDWNLGPHSNLRGPRVPGLPGDFLLEDGSNLPHVINRFQHLGQPYETLMAYMKRLNGRFERVTPNIEQGSVQVYIQEQGLTTPTPSTRLSDGTLRFLSLLAVLCHPKAPPLVCIEEPELGLHPYAIPIVADLLVEASKRMQLIVTTHSDALVSALSHVPESVIVCERWEDGTSLRRLEPDKLREWLAKYSLGELWMRDHFGGVR